MSYFVDRAGAYIAEGHHHDEDVLRAALTAALSDGPASQAARLAESAPLSETWYCEHGGFGHDCAAHQDVDRSLWSPHCGTFRPVTVAAGVPAPSAVERAVMSRSAESTGVA